ncbi:MAG TPA: ATP-binding protein [Acidobacteriaceae bacterium]|jgi:signal transduction histidine kinase|nr:ATP-binding protein [Acidobacteriaceae bacterium]
MTNATQPGAAKADKTALFAKPAELLATLHQIPALAGMSEDQLHCLSAAELIEMPAGTVFVKQGETDHFYWIILEGGTRIFQKQADGREITVARVPGQNAFGELPILSNSGNPTSVETISPTRVLKLSEAGFWQLMMECPAIRQQILEAMAWRSQRLQQFALQQDKLASLGTLAAGLMHELNNPGAAAQRAAKQLRENLVRLQELSLSISRREGTPAQKQCIAGLQEQALANRLPVHMNSLDQSDAEEALRTWMEEKAIANAWKLAPTLVGIGLTTEQMECARVEFEGDAFSDVLNWLEALVSSVQLVGTIEESIGRVSELVHAVKSYAYEGKGQMQNVDVNDSLHSTLVILGHKLREKQIEIEKDFAADLPPIHTAGTGLNQVWTNLLDNAADALAPHGKIQIRTWAEGAEVCVSIADNGSGIPQECQAHIFEPFFTTKEVGVGTGLGLDIAHRIVAQQYAGHISFTSKPGRTEFLIRLPKERS